jgi:hypothetical protein
MRQKRIYATASGLKILGISTSIFVPYADILKISEDRYDGVRIDFKLKTKMGYHVIYSPIVYNWKGRKNAKASICLLEKIRLDAISRNVTS